MGKRLVLFIFIFLTWLVLTWPINYQNIIAGLAVGVFIAAIVGDLFIKRPHHFRQPVRYLWFCYFIVVFIEEYLKANFDIISRILNPKLPINPGIIKVNTTLKSDTGLTFLANSITLALNSFCVDINPKEGTLYIHWIDVLTQDKQKATQLIVTKFENILKRIFE